MLLPLVSKETIVSANLNLETTLKQLQDLEEEDRESALCTLYDKRLAAIKQENPNLAEYCRAVFNEMLEGGESDRAWAYICGVIHAYDFLLRQAESDNTR